MRLLVSVVDAAEARVAAAAGADVIDVKNPSLGAIGEAAPLIVVGGVVFATQVPSLNPLEANDTPLLAMPLQIFFWAGQPQESFQELAAAGIIVLLGTLVLMNLVAIFLRNKYSRRW